METDEAHERSYVRSNNLLMREALICCHDRDVYKDRIDAALKLHAAFEEAGYTLCGVCAESWPCETRLALSGAGALGQVVAARADLEGSDHGTGV